MYQVTNDYTIAKNKPIHRFKISGTVGNVAFDESNILSGSLSISNKMTDGNDILVGSVTIGVLQCTFLGLNITENSDIVLSEGLRLQDGTYEYVPLGIYRIAEANTTRSGTEVTAYDRMSFFNKNFNISTSYGTLYELADLACTECNVPFGMSQSEMSNMPNGTFNFSLHIQNDIETWQDYIYWIAQTMGGFATINRNGQLVFRIYRKTVDDTIDCSHRFTGASFSKFTVKYSGISVVDIDNETTSYYGLEDDRYLTYNLGSNPFLQYGDNLEQMRRNVLDSIAEIEYTPFTAKSNVGALYDLGDIIQYTEGLADGTNMACVMRYDWHYNGGTELEGVGKNPALANARSKTDKQIQGLLNSTKTDTVRYYLFTNAYDVTIGDGQEKTIANIRFASMKETTVIFHAEISLDVDTTVIDDVFYDAVATVTYRYNDTETLDYHPQETWTDGNHVLHLLYYFEIDSSVVTHLEVLLNMNGGSVFIPQGNIKGSLYGQALVAQIKWDGTFDIRENVPKIDVMQINPIEIVSMDDALELSQQIPTPINISQGYALINVSQIEKLTVTEINEIIEMRGLT